MRRSLAHDIEVVSGRYVTYAAFVGMTLQQPPFYLRVAARARCGGMPRAVFVDEVVDYLPMEQLFGIDRVPFDSLGFGSCPGASQHRAVARGIYRQRDDAVTRLAQPTCRNGAVHAAAVSQQYVAPVMFHASKDKYKIRQKQVCLQFAGRERIR